MSKNSAFPENSAFSPDIPGLQLFWDATSMNEFKTCPRLYFFSIVRGFASEKKSSDLAFGIAFHSAIERFYRLRAQGMDFESAVHWTIAATFFRQLLSSHEEAIPEDAKAEKKPKVLLRALVAYFDSVKNDNLHTIILPSGKPAVELSFSFPLPGTPFFWSGHIDRLASQGTPLDLRNPLPEKLPPIFASDYKTTTSALDQRYWSQWDLSIQMSGYTVGGKVLLECRGVVIEAVQLSVTGQSFGRYVVAKTTSQLEDFLLDLGQDLEQAKTFALAGRWPRNPTSCIHYGRVCAFHDVCKLSSPAQQDAFLESGFIRKIWNPRENR